MTDKSNWSERPPIYPAEWMEEDPRYHDMLSEKPAKGLDSDPIACWIMGFVTGGILVWAFKWAL